MQGRQRALQQQGRRQAWQQPGRQRATPPILTPKRSLSFNDVDKVFNHDTLEENTVSAPKTIERLEEISKMRTAQRKAEEEDEKDEDAFKISDNDANIDLDIVPL